MGDGDGEGEGDERADIFECVVRVLFRRRSLCLKS